MEGAARHPVGALLLQRYVVLDDPDDISLAFEIVDKDLGIAHWICLTLA